jgi:hypothetical protein
MAKKRIDKTKITTLEVAYHRNGVSGDGFHVVRFIDPDEGNDVMVGIVFKAPGHVAVLSVNRLAGLGGREATVAFGVNSYRGDVYAPFLRRAAAQFEKEARS